MANAKVTKHRLEETKKAVDFIYALTNNRIYSAGWAKYNYGLKRVATILIKRGVLVPIGNKIKQHTYKWNPNAMEPTENFYLSIAQEIADKEYSYKEWRRDKKDVTEENPVKEIPVVKASPKPIIKTEATTYVVKSKIVDFSDQELWNELARRGFTVEDNHIIKRVVLI